ncbi:MAG: hypothetical protein WKF47_05840 [Geodermatophilaceae bacterium]
MRPLVVVGDALLDIDLVGRSDRLCPDAPVPVVEDVTEQARPGGAALAAILAADDGRDVVLIAPVADDADGAQLRSLLKDRVRLIAVPIDGQTPVKRRVRVNGQSLVRLDSGRVGSTIGALPAEAVEALRTRHRGARLRLWARHHRAARCPFVAGRRRICRLGSAPARRRAGAWRPTGHAERRRGRRCGRQHRLVAGRRRAAGR